MHLPFGTFTYPNDETATSAWTIPHPGTYGYSVGGSGGGYHGDKNTVLNQINALYVSLYNAYQYAYPESSDTYETLLRMYNGDYKKTVIAIETELQRKANESFTAVTGD